MSTAEYFYDLMGYESEINKIIDRIESMSSLDEESANSIRSEHRAKIVSRIIELYSEGQLAQLVEFFESDLGQMYMKNQRNILPDYPEYMRELLNKHLNAGRSSNGPHFLSLE